MNRSRAKGTSWEQAIADYLRERGWPHAERRAMNGSNDRGDITGLPLVVIEAKNAQTWAVPEWLREAEIERSHDRADLGVVWIKRRMSTSPGAAYVVMDGHTFTELLKKAGY